MDSPARALTDFLQFTLPESIIHRSGVILELRRPWDKNEDFWDVAHIFADLARRTALTAIAFQGNTQSGKLSRKAKAQAVIVDESFHGGPPVLVFDNPVGTFRETNDPLMKTSIIIVDSLSRPRLDTRGYAHLYDLKSIIKRRPAPRVNIGITGPWLKFFECYCESNLQSPDHMRRL